MAEINSFPFEIIDVEDKTNKKLLENFQGEKTGFVKVGPKKYFFPYSYKKQAKNYYNFDVRNDDIWVVSFPRSGTTLTQELVWMIANDLNYKKASEIKLVKRFPFFEFGLFFHDEIKHYLIDVNDHSNFNQLVDVMKHGWEFLPHIKERRFIKTHFPFSLLPKNIFTTKCKLIYVARHPKDIAVSYYHLNRLFVTQGFSGTFKQYWNFFEENLQPWMPYWDHIFEAWEERNNPNVLFLFYEEIVKDMKSVIQKVSIFLEKELSEEDIEKLEKYLHIDNFRVNPSVNMDEFKDLKIIKNEEQGFIRNGKTGKNNEWTPELNAKIDEWIDENMKRINIQFYSTEESIKQANNV